MNSHSQFWSWGGAWLTILTGSGRLASARRLMEKISLDKVIQGISGQEEADDSWYEDVDFWAGLMERSEISNMTPEQVLAEARNFRGLEALVRALDGLETVASLMVLSTEYVHLHFPAIHGVRFD